MKKIIKLFLKSLGSLLYLLLNFPILVFISDTFVNALSGIKLIQGVDVLDEFVSQLLNSKNGK